VKNKTNEKKKMELIKYLTIENFSKIDRNLIEKIHVIYVFKMKNKQASKKKIECIN
jgi:hypothetical protein